MNNIDIQKRLINKLENLSSEQLNSVWQFIESLEEKQPTNHILVEKFQRLSEEAEALHKDNPLTEADIQSEIDTYRSGT